MSASIASIQTACGDDSNQHMPKRIRVLAFMEASSVTGPAKNLIRFARNAIQPIPGSPEAEIVIATFHRSSAPAPNPFVSACREAGLETHVIRERFAFDPRIISAVRELIASEQPQIVQTHSVKSHFLIKLTGVYRHVSWIAFQHGYTWPDRKMRLYNQLDRLSLPSAHQVVTVCRPFAAALERIGVEARRITVQHNAVESAPALRSDRLSEIRKSLGIQQDAIVLLTVGRLSREKGHVDLIEAIGRMRSENPSDQWRLVIVGDGPERQHILAAAQHWRVSDYVILAGQQTDVAPYYGIADVAVLPSHSEGSPNVLFEAMSSGLAIVSTTVGGIPEIAKNGEDALLVEKANPDALARALAQLMRDGALRSRLGMRARKTASAFSPDAYCASMLGLYSRMLEESVH